MIKLFRSRAGAICLLVLVLLLGAIGWLLQLRVRDMISTYVEEQVARQAHGYAGEINLTIDRELERLRYLRMELSGEDLRPLDRIEGEGCLLGLLTLQGQPVKGSSFSSAVWPAVRYAAHGKEKINYNRGQGLLFAVPVYNGANVRYVLYRYYTEAAMRRRLSMEFFDGDGRAILRMRGQDIPVTYEEWTEADEAGVARAEREGLLNTLQEKILATGAGAVYHPDSGLVFFATDVPQLGATLVGYVPYESVCGSLLDVGRMVMLVFVLISALFAVGCGYLVRADSQLEENEELKKAREDADRASRAKSDFLASMSHEIRTPLNAILGINELILRESKEPLTREYAQNIEGSGRALLALINDVLDFSKIEVGRLTLAPRRYELARLISDVVQIVQVRADRKGLALELHISEDMPRELYGDPNRVSQVLINLLTNAVKYTPQGKVKLVMTTVKTNLWNTGAVEPPEDPSQGICLLACRVEDTGIGIRREDLTKLFHIFVRLEEKRNSNIEGTGLGLALTHKLVASMGGFLDVASIYGVGSSFTAWIPQYIMDAAPLGSLESRETKKTDEQTEYRPLFVAPEAKVLAVDDNKMNRFVVENLLKASRVQLDLAESGKEALEKMRRKKYDLVLLDHMMPEMDGVETLQAAMEEGLTEGVPVIALTANAIAGAKERYFSLGFTDYLSKPVSGRKLEEMVMQYLPKGMVQVLEEEKAEPEPETAKLASEAESAVSKSEREKVEDLSVARLKAESRFRAESPDHMPHDDVVLIDTGLGLEYCAEDWEIYGEMLEIFAESREEEQGKMARAIQDMNWKAYATSVHALKSTSLSIGANHLSNQAKELETAAKAEEKQYIVDNHEAVMNLYDKVAEEAQRLAAEHGQAAE